MLLVKFPEHEIELLERQATNVVYGRVKAGFHYPSDNESGILLGEKMYVFMNKAELQKRKLNSNTIFRKSKS